MNIMFDTSFLVQIDRKNSDVIKLAKLLIKKGFHFWISTITVAEIMTGVYLRKDLKEAKGNALSILNQFNWMEFSGPIAFKTGQLLSYLYSENKIIDFQDVAIAATALEVSAEYLITENKKDFIVIPVLRDKVFNIQEMIKKIS